MLRFRFGSNCTEPRRVGKFCCEPYARIIATSAAGDKAKTGNCLSQSRQLLLWKLDHHRVFRIHDISNSNPSNLGKKLKAFPSIKSVTV